MRGENGEFIPLYLYPRSVIDNPPSVRHGHLTLEQESLNRALGCVLIAKAGHMLTLPQSTISSAHVLLHRFYFRVSMHTYKLLRVCMTAVFLASKVEETPVRLRDVLACFDRLLKRRAGFDPTPLSEQRYDVWAANLASCEGAMLRELGFELYIDLPHAFILHFLAYLHPHIDDAPPSEQRTWGELRQRSWNALNDALLSPRLLFVFHPHVLACGAIVLAASLLSLPLPPDWWRLFDVSTRALDSCALEFAQMYALLSQQPAGLDYISVHPADDENSNELCKFRPQSRQARLEASRRAREAAAPSASAGLSEQARGEESKTDTAASAATSANPDSNSSSSSSSSSLPMARQGVHSPPHFLSQTC